MEQIQYIVPAWMATIIANDDYSATTDAEELLARNFLQSAFDQFGPGYWFLGEENGFAYNEVDHFLGDTYNVVYCYTPSI